MSSTSVVKTPRIEVVDALRGLAILAIVLIHNIEHFNLYDFPKTDSAFLQSLNKCTWEAVFFLFGGKAYAIFALLFGFSFHIQYRNRMAQGKDFAGRFLWRLLLLAGFGLVHALFYTGDILILYAAIGVILVPVRKASNRLVALLAVILMLQPLELGKFFYALFTPGYMLPESTNNFWELTQEGLKSTSIWTMVKSNICNGEWYSLSWAWNNGRFFQTASLFLIGLLLGRNGLFSDSLRTVVFWKKTLWVAAACFVPLFLIKTYLFGSALRAELLQPLKVVVSSWSNVAFMFVLVALFILIWYRSKAKKKLALLTPYGKMSLTNYITQSIIGTFIYCGYGLGMYQYLGVTASLLVGLFLFLLQLLFCRWWLQRHRQGPLEMLWHKATWIRS